MNRGPAKQQKPWGKKNGGALVGGRAKKRFKATIRVGVEIWEGELGSARAQGAGNSTKKWGSELKLGRKWRRAFKPNTDRPTRWESKGQP